VLNLQASSLDWALEHSLKLGDTDVFPVPFEYEALKHAWDETKAYLLQQNVRSWTVRPQRTLVAAKSRCGFRVVTQLDPLDFIIFAALIREIGADLEQARVPVQENVVFSYRFGPQPEGDLFDRQIGYRQFLERAEGILDESPELSYVAVTDIADFYHRIYHHRLENALDAATNREAHVRALLSLLSQWNGTETFGIPVGNAPSRLLAEVTIADVDQALLARGIAFLRYNDDYRIFARSYAEAYRHLTFLADFLYRAHGLSLHPHKTDIVDADVFRQRWLPGPEERELTSLQQRFRQFVDDLGLSSEYEQIDYDDLDPNDKQFIDSLNLEQLLLDELGQDGEPDAKVLRFVLRRLGQLGESSLVDTIFENIDSLYHVFPDVIRYLQGLDLSAEDSARIGRTVLSLLGESTVSQLEYHRMWALDLFTGTTRWDCQDEFPRLLEQASHDTSRRKLILAMGRAGQRYWFQSQWRSLLDFAAWPRRALLAGGSCLPEDARSHWYRSMRSRLDPLERAVVRWAKDHPFA